LHSFNLFWIHPDAILANQMTQVFYFGGTKITITLFQEKLVLGEEMEDLIHMSKMVCPGFSIDEDIIKEN
jgi:hypothetical protein